MPKIPRLKYTSFPEQSYMRTLIKPPSTWSEPVPIQGPNLPRVMEYYRQGFKNYWPERQDFQMRRPSLEREYAKIVAQERARQAYNQKLIEDAVRLRKEELWREYMEEEDPPPGIGWPAGKGEELDEGFEEQARWDVYGMVNPNDNFWGITDDEFREKYKDAPWRMW